MPLLFAGIDILPLVEELNDRRTGITKHDIADFKADKTQTFVQFLRVLKFLAINQKKLPQDVRFAWDALQPYLEQMKSRPEVLIALMQSPPLRADIEGVPQEEASTEVMQTEEANAEVGSFMDAVAEGSSPPRPKIKPARREKYTLRKPGKGPRMR